MCALACLTARELLTESAEVGRDDFVLAVKAVGRDIGSGSGTERSLHAPAYRLH